MYELARQKQIVALLLWLNMAGGEVCHSECAIVRAEVGCTYLGGSQGHTTGLLKAHGRCGCMWGVMSACGARRDVRERGATVPRAAPPFAGEWCIGAAGRCTPERPRRLNARGGWTRGTAKVHTNCAAFEQRRKMQRRAELRCVRA